MTLQDIVKQESELKCYIDMLALSHSSAPFPMCYTDTMLPFKYHLCVRKASAWCGVGGGDLPGHGSLPLKLVKL